MGSEFHALHPTLISKVSHVVATSLLLTTGVNHFLKPATRSRCRQGVESVIVCEFA